MNLNGLSFQVSVTAANGVVSSDTRLELIQRGNRILGRYQGGRIERGYLVGSVAGQSLHFRFCQRETIGAIQGGRSRCFVDTLSDGRLRIREHFTGATRDSFGVNIFDQVDTRPSRGAS